MDASLESTKRFSDRVENYVKYRPHYPESVFAFLKERFHLGSGSAVADVGSGTGISTGPLLKLGCTTYAVEPNGEMRKAAEIQFASNPGFKSIDGTAEKTSLPGASIDLILCAQAFHWFDPAKTRVEFLRVLKPGGAVVLMWNIRVETGTPFLEGYEHILETFGTDYAKVKRQNVMSNGALETLFGETKWETKTFRNGQSFDFEGLKGRLLSSSYIPNEGHPKYEPMSSELKRLFEENADGGKVEMPYETNLYFGTL